jgi:hypothetical protein
MPTENPKISAYVPQVVYDRFMRFKEEHDLSMSQAAIEIFAAYFGINLNPTVFNEFTSELQSRLETLEKALADLQESHFVLSKKVDLMQSTSEPPIIEPIEVPVDKDIDSESNSSSQNELPKQDVVEQTIDVNIIDEPDSSLDSELFKENIIDNANGINNTEADLSNRLLSEPKNSYSALTLFDDSNDLLSSLKSNPLKYELLATRLGVSAQTLVNQKSRLGIDDGKLSDWLQSKDPDKILWLFVAQKRGIRYVPADDTPIEKLEKLNEWIQANV